MKIVIVSPKNKTLYNFRGDLIKDMIKMGHEVVAIGPNFDNIEEVNKLGVRFIATNVKKDSINVFGDLKYYFNLKKIFLLEKPDLVFSYTMKPVVYASIAAKKTNVKKIYAMMTGIGRVYSSNTIKMKFLKKISGMLLKKSFACCNNVVFQNKDDKIKFEKLKYLSEKKSVIVNGSGVNMDKFLVKEMPKKNEYVMISRIIKEKGVIEYLNAAKLVKEKYPEVNFKLIGALENKKSQIKMKDLQPFIDLNIIEYIGEVKDVKPYIEMSRMLILPTYYGEGLPRIILEAMAIGRPVIATDWPGCKDAIENGKNGLLVNPKDHVDLAKKIIYSIENTKMIDKMAKSSYKMCKEKFEINVINKKMLEIMQIEEV